MIKGMLKYLQVNRHAYLNRFNFGMTVKALDLAWLTHFLEMYRKQIMNARSKTIPMVDQQAQVGTHQFELSRLQPLYAEQLSIAFEQTKRQNRCRQYDMQIDQKLEMLDSSSRGSLYLLCM